MSVVSTVEDAVIESLRLGVDLHMAAELAHVFGKLCAAQGVSLETGAAACAFALHYIEHNEGHTVQVAPIVELISQAAPLALKKAMS